MSFMNDAEGDSWCNGKRPGFGNKQTGVQILVVLLSHSVALGKSTTFPEPLFLYRICRY